MQRGAAAWNKKTVVVVDEAAMVSTDMLGRVAGAAEKAGAKLILAGDDAQLGSIERGGMFETLRLQHGAAVLQQVQRVKDAPQQAAFNEMHKGKFRAALDTFAKSGGIVWTEQQDDALRDMAAAYTADHAADPAKKRFMIAATNAEVDALNSYARAMRQQRGDLGQDHTVKTAHGDLAVAVGDRIQFTGNGGTKTQKNAGLVTSGFATVKAVEVAEGKPARITIAFDSATTKGGGETPRELSFTVGGNAKAGEFNRFKLGYAGTIYKAQGDDARSSLCLSFPEPPQRDLLCWPHAAPHEREDVRFARGDPQHGQGAEDISARESATRRPTSLSPSTSWRRAWGGSRTSAAPRRTSSTSPSALALTFAASRRRHESEARSGLRRCFDIHETERQQARRRSILQALSRLLGREVTQEEGRDILRQQGREQQL